MELEDMLTLAAILSIVAAIAFFSQEINRMAKKMFAVKWVWLFLPLTLASSLVYCFQPEVTALLYFFHNHLSQWYDFLVWLLPPSSYSGSIALVILLTGISLIPVLGLQWYSYKKTYKAYPYSYLVSTLIWIVSVLLLISFSTLKQIKV